MSLHGRRLLLLNGRRAPSTRAFSPWSASYPTPLHAVWAGDPAWSNPGDGNAVSSWRNQSGGGDPAQAVGTAQPTYRASTAAFNNRPTVETDGGDTLSVDVDDIAQPLQFVLVGNWGAVGSTYRMFGAPTSSVGRVFFENDSSGGKWRLWGGSARISTATDADTDPHIFACTLDGASSAIDLDGSEDATGNPGTAGLVGIRLFGDSDPTGNLMPAGSHIAYFGVYAGAADLSGLVAALANHYGLSAAISSAPSEAPTESAVDITITGTQLGLVETVRLT